MESLPNQETRKIQRSGGSPVGRSSCWTALQRWILWGGFAFFTVFGWVRLASSLENWQWLNYAGVLPGPLYLAITGGLWGIAGLVALIWMALRRTGFRRVGLGAAVFFALTYWIDRLFVANRTGGGNNTVFAVLITVLGLVYVALALRPVHPLRTKSALQEPGKI